MSSTSLNLHVRPGTDALNRVVSTCRRRGLSIVALTYEDRRLAITLAGSYRRTKQIQYWLAALIDVLDVVQAADRAAGRPESDVAANDQRPA